MRCVVGGIADEFVAGSGGEMDFAELLLQDAGDGRRVSSAPALGATAAPHLAHGRVE